MNLGVRRKHRGKRFPGPRRSSAKPEEWKNLEKGGKGTRQRPGRKGVPQKKRPRDCKGGGKYTTGPDQGRKRACLWWKRPVSCRKERTSLGKSGQFRGDGPNLLSGGGDCPGRKGGKRIGARRKKGTALAKRRGHYGGSHTAGGKVGAGGKKSNGVLHPEGSLRIPGEKSVVTTARGKGPGPACCSSGKGATSLASQGEKMSSRVADRGGGRGGRKREKKKR